MLDHKIIRLRAAQRRSDVIKPFVGERCVDRVDDGDLFVFDNVGIVRHSGGDSVLTFEQVDPAVVHADVEYVFGNLHFLSPLRTKKCFSP